MKFKFSLEKVLRQRNIEVEIAQKNFIDAQRAYEQEQDRLNQMINLKQQSIAERYQLTQGQGHWLNRVDQINEFLVGQDQRIKNQNQRLSEFEKVVESKREILKVALTEAKIIEKLKEKKKAEFVSKIMKEEQAELDELAVLRFSRNENQK